MDINIYRVIDNGQILAVVKLAEKIWQEHYVPLIGKQQVDYMLAKYQSYQAIVSQIAKGYLYYLCSENQNHIGYLGVLPEKDQQRMFLSKVYLIKKRRGQGLGQKILVHIQDLCHQMNLNKIWLTVNKGNTDSIKAYQKMGFKKKSSLIQDIGNGFFMDDYLMEKDIL